MLTQSNMNSRPYFNDLQGRIGFRGVMRVLETVDEKPSYRNAFLKKRYIIPMDTFFIRVDSRREWKSPNQS